jgi:hypothetical protein
MINPGTVMDGLGSGEVLFGVGVCVFWEGLGVPAATRNSVCALLVCIAAAGSRLPKTSAADVRTRALCACIMIVHSIHPCVKNQTGGEYTLFTGERALMSAYAKVTPRAVAYR